MRNTLVVGNWKMNGGLRSNAALLDAIVRDLAIVDAQKDVVTQNVTRFGGPA